MPEQPLSSRLSLAQAVVSVNSRSKAVSIGLEKGNSAEEDGWGQGQPRVRVMGREIRVMKRWGYDWKEEDSQDCHSAAQVLDSQETIKADDSVPAISETNANEVVKTEDQPPALWGLDLEALRSSNEGQGGGPHGTHKKDVARLPIYTAESARSYLLKSFTSATVLPGINDQQKKKSISTLKAENEHNLALLLATLEKLYVSWAHVLSQQELDRRSWGWYVAVRPEIQQGVAGWGEKGDVRLSSILDLRRTIT